ncbi:MAG: hypothetical protein KH452_11975 [Clostridiales bacterium]|nr:hypothetical protein [Clostridiales bacterium]
MRYSEKEKRKELEVISEFLDSVEIASEIVPKGKLFSDVSLLVCLPSIEELPDEIETASMEQVHLASLCFGDLDEEDQRISKYLSFYSQIHTEMKTLDEETVLRLVNQMNQRVRFGHYFYGEVEGSEEKLVQYRATLVCAAEDQMDESVVANMILEMGVGYDMMKEALKEAAEGKQ